MHRSYGAGTANNTRGSVLINSVLIVLIIGLLGASAFLYHRSTRQSFEEKYQLIALTSGDVFVGTVTQQSKRTTTLENIYFVPVDAGELFTKELHIASAFSVIKVGNEVHGPEDEMFISNEHIMFIQNLRDDSQIVSAIREYEL